MFLANLNRGEVVIEGKDERGGCCFDLFESRHLGFDQLKASHNARRAGRSSSHGLPDSTWIVLGGKLAERGR